MKPQIYIFQTQFSIFATCSSLTASHIQAGRKDEIGVSSLCVKWSKFRLVTANVIYSTTLTVEEFDSVEPSVKEHITNKACCQSNTRSPIKSIVQKCARPSRGGRMKSPENMSTSIRHA
jgi:hypothetical protein